jgi:hypothetical protein
MKNTINIEKVMATILKYDIINADKFGVDFRTKKDWADIRKTLQILFDKYGVTFGYWSERHNYMLNNMLVYLHDYTPTKLAKYSYDMWYSTKN